MLTESHDEEQIIARNETPIIRPGLLWTFWRIYAAPQAFPSIHVE
jgi:hypothetical protein